MMKGKELYKKKGKGRRWKSMKVKGGRVIPRMRRIGYGREGKYWGGKGKIMGRIW